MNGRQPAVVCGVSTVVAYGVWLLELLCYAVVAQGPGRLMAWREWLHGLCGAGYAVRRRDRGLGLHGHTEVAARAPRTRTTMRDCTHLIPGGGMEA